jgi:RNA polymerase subunit RPABC4/transcription elongation factor Spt4
MLKKSTIIKGLILLLVAGVMTGIGWKVVKKEIIKEKGGVEEKIKKKKKTIEKRLITKQEAINIAKKLGYGQPYDISLNIYHPDPANHYEIYDSEGRKIGSIYEYLGIKNKHLWLLKYGSPKKLISDLVIIINAESGKILKILKNVSISRPWVDKIFK